MSQIGRKHLRKLLKKILKDNDSAKLLAGYNRLRGTAKEKATACTEARNILALTELNDGAAWDGDQGLRNVLRDLRADAKNVRNGASLRILACRRLAVIEGYLDQKGLGDSPVDDLIRKLLKPEIAVTDTFVESASSLTFDERLARITQKFGGDTCRGT